MKINEKIRLLRTLRGYKQENIAHALGISRQTYGEMERGEHEISEERLFQITKELGTTPEVIKEFDPHFANFFDHCTGATGGVIGVNTGNIHNNEDKPKIEKLEDEIEKLKLKLALSQNKVAKAELEAKYLREKYEK